MPEAKVYKPRELTRKQWAAHKAWITKRAKYGKTGRSKNVKAEKSDE